ncbi:hypothetical protein CSA17_07095 [bacterium DOLJORAL78_65_58]|nr:MAG: hypothetical protein CSA17_07095 [bacterium DOLJORAL78_65_58]
MISFVAIQSNIYPVIGLWALTAILAGVALNGLRRRARQLETRITTEAQSRHQLFKQLPIALWRQDLSQVRAALRDLPAGDAADLLDEHPDRVEHLLSLVRSRDVNSATARLLEAPSPPALLTRFPEIMAPAALTVFGQALAALLAGRQTFEAETELVTLEGNHRRVQLHFLRSPHDEAWDDIHLALHEMPSEEADQNPDQEQRYNLLDTRKLDSLGCLASGVAHDFNNLLMSILGNADLALQEYHQDLAQIAPIIQGDSSQIQQVVVNLLTNAVEAIGEQDGNITLETGQMEATEEHLRSQYTCCPLAPGHYAFLRVEDDGAGIAPEQLGQVFDPFFTTKFSSRGMGLAAVLGIVRMHQGSVLVNSEPGKGTTMTVLIPLSEAAVATKTESVPRGEVLEKWQASGQLLLADDEPGVRRVAARMLDKLGFEVILAEDGLQAVEIFHAQRDSISIVILDAPDRPPSSPSPTP